MVHWLRDKLLAAGRTLDAIVRRSRRHWLWSGCVCLACMILLAVLFHGCEQRQAVRTTPQMDAASQFWVRVLLAANVTECTLATSSPIDVIQGRTGPAVEATGHSLEPVRQPQKITLSGGRLMLGEIVLPGSDVVLSPQLPYVFRLNGDDYRGQLRLIINSQGQGFDVINMVQKYEDTYRALSQCDNVMGSKT